MFQQVAKPFDRRVDLIGTRRANLQELLQLLVLDLSTFVEPTHLFEAGVNQSSKFLAPFAVG